MRETSNTTTTPTPVIIVALNGATAPSGRAFLLRQGGPAAGDNGALVTSRAGYRNGQGARGVTRLLARRSY